MARRNWTREETILAMDLYTRIPFSQIGKNNQEIIQLSHIINNSRCTSVKNGKFGSLRFRITGKKSFWYVSYKQIR